MQQQQQQVVGLRRPALTPCLSALDFRNIECHSIFFQFRNIKFKKLKNQFDFKIEFQFLKIEACTAIFLFYLFFGIKRLFVNRCVLAKIFNAFFQISTCNYLHKFSLILLKYESLTKWYQFLIRFENSKEKSSISAMKFSQQFVILKYVSSIISNRYAQLNN